MRPQDAKIGTRVRSLVAFSGVPLGTEDVIDEDYRTGVTIAWDVPEHRLPTGYRIYDGRPAIQSGILRDGFDKATALHYLAVVLLCDICGLRLSEDDALGCSLEGCDAFLCGKWVCETDHRDTHGAGRQYARDVRGRERP